MFNIFSLWKKPLLRKNSVLYPSLLTAFSIMLLLYIFVIAALFGVFVADFFAANYANAPTPSLVDFFVGRVTQITQFSGLLMKCALVGGCVHGLILLFNFKKGSVVEK